MNHKLRVPCAYQGGKQRIASQIIDHLFKNKIDANTIFYDLCCGSGAISIELVNRGIEPEKIVMLDISSWGVFWKAIGTGIFKMEVFDDYLSNLPSDKYQFKDYLKKISLQPIGQHEAELYPILQACSFGGKQIWSDGVSWGNSCFRDYWMPTETSTRRSPANPMQPSPDELRRRVTKIIDAMKGVNCINADIMTIAKAKLPKNSLVYIDPPYQSTTGYAFNFDLQVFISEFKKANNIPLFISESKPLVENALPINFGGSNGGISGTRKTKHQEWLNQI